MQSFILNHALSNAYHLLSRSGLPLNQPLETGIRSTLSSNTVLGNPGAANRAEAGLLPVLWTTLKKLCSLYMYVACVCVCIHCTDSVNDYNNHYLLGKLISSVSIFQTEWDK